MGQRHERPAAAPGQRMRDALAKVRDSLIVRETEAERIIVNVRPSGHIAFTVFPAQGGDGVGGVLRLEE